MPESLRAVQHPDGITGCWSGRGKAAPAFFLVAKHTAEEVGETLRKPPPPPPPGAERGTVPDVYRVS